MSLIVVLGLWLVLGGSIYRAEKRGRSTTDAQALGRSDVVLGHRSAPPEIPDTVPSDWIEAYRAEHDG